MKLVVIIGGGAVGKMTVGQELCKITDLRLFHNHMTIDLVTRVFGYYDGETITRLRRVVFEEFAKSGNYGLVFTYIWDFSSPRDGDYIRNKPGKRDLDFSEALIYDEKTCRVESLPGETGFKNYLKIDNTDLPATEAARQIKDYFGL